MQSNLYNECAGSWLAQTTRFWGGKKIRVSCATWSETIEDVLGCVSVNKLKYSKTSGNGVITHRAKIWLKSGSTMEFDFHYLKSDKDGALHLVKNNDDIKLELI